MVYFKVIGAAICFGIFISINGIFGIDILKDHVWNQEVCIKTNSGDSYCQLVYTSAKNLSESVLDAKINFCKQIEHSNIETCCNNKLCISKMLTSFENKLRYGMRIFDPLAELNRRRQENDLLVAYIDEIVAANVNNKIVDTHKMIFVQVGANVGATINDPIFPIITKMPNLNSYGLLFEPSVFHYKGLKYNYNEYKDRVQMINKAFCETEGQSTFLHAKLPDGDPGVEKSHTEFSPIFDFMYRTHKSQMSILSNEKNYQKLTRTVKAPHVAAFDCINSLETYLKPIYNTCSASSMSAHDIVFAIDAEGTDIIVLRYIFSERYYSIFPLPRVIVFEFAFMRGNELAEIFHVLDLHGYICDLYTSMDIICTIPKQCRPNYYVGPACCKLNSLCSKLCGLNTKSNGEESCNAFNVFDNNPSTEKSYEDPSLVGGIFGEDFKIHHPKNTAVLICAKFYGKVDACKDRIIPHITGLWLRNHSGFKVITDKGFFRIRTL
eukprot:g1157.t1